MEKGHCPLGQWSFISNHRDLIWKKIMVALGSPPW